MRMDTLCKVIETQKNSDGQGGFITSEVEIKSFFAFVTNISNEKQADQFGILDTSKRTLITLEDMDFRKYIILAEGEKFKVILQKKAKRKTFLTLEVIN